MLTPWLQYRHKYISYNFVVLKLIEKLQCRLWIIFIIECIHPIEYIPINIVDILKYYVSYLINQDVIVSNVIVFILQWQILLNKQHIYVYIIYR